MAKKINFEKIKKFFFLFWPILTPFSQETEESAQNEAVFGKKRKRNLTFSIDKMFLHKNHETQIYAKKAKLSFICSHQNYKIITKVAKFQLVKNVKFVFFSSAEMFLFGYVWTKNPKSCFLLQYMDQTK